MNRYPKLAGARMVFYYSKKKPQYSFDILKSFFSSDTRQSIKRSGILSGYAKYSVNNLRYQKNSCLKKLIPLKPKIQYSHSLLYKRFTLDCHH